MKRFIILLLIMLLLGGVAYMINQNKVKKGGAQISSMDISDRKFAVDDIDEVAKITVQKAYKDGYLLEKKGKDWYINGKHKVSKAIMFSLLEPIKKITIQNIPPSTMIPLIKEEMERLGIHVQIYDKNDNLLRSYKVGTQASDDKGTAMILDGKSQPYNLFMPGFEGELRRRYWIENIDSWRAREVFETEVEDIEELTFEFHRTNSMSFTIDNTGELPTIKPLSEFVKNNKPTNTKAITDYLKIYKKLYAENFDNNNYLRDSISSLDPYATVTLKTKNEDPLVVKFHSYAEVHKFMDEGKVISQAEMLSRFYADMSTGDFMLVQGRVFNPIFRPLGYFLEH